MNQGLIRAALVLVAIQSAWGADVYRWQDAAGQWHYGDAVAAAQNAKVIQITPPVLVPFAMPTSTLSAGMMPTGANPQSAYKSGKNKEKRRESAVSKPPSTRKSGKAKSQSPTNVQHSSFRGAPPPVEDRDAHREYCDRWRDRLHKSRLRLRDHEAQYAYDRECISKEHW